MEFNNVLQNLDIVIYIYKQLNVDDQFRLAQVNTELKDVFERYIFPQDNYSTLTVIGNHDYFIVTNETNRNRMALKPAELKEFLHYHAPRVQVFAELNSIIFDVRPFQYLTKLFYGFMNISQKHLKFLTQLEKNCPKLELLHVDCCLDENRSDIMVGKNWSVDSLVPMKKLKSIKVNMPHGPSNWTPLSYQDFRKLVTELKLDYLNLRCIVQPAKGIPKITGNIFAQPVHLKKIDIGFNFGPKANLSPYLKIFENLVTLIAIVRGEEITDLLLTNIANACVNLKVFHIQDSYFRNILSFTLPPQLTELALLRCEGLSCNNLKQILTELKLTKFSSQDVDYDGVFEDFALSDNLQELDFDVGYTNDINLAFGGSLNLKNLSWNNGAYRHMVTADNLALGRCINLEVLDMQHGFMDTNTLSHLKMLHKLTIPPSMAPSSWSYITAILQHPSLREFIMNKYYGAENLQAAKDIPVDGFATNVRIVKITREVFALALEFWLDLFDRNKELQLEVYNFRGDSAFMRKLITHEKFPRYLRTLDVCLFTIKCSDLRRHLENTMDKLRKDLAHFKYENDEYLYRIVFCRSKN